MRLQDLPHGAERLAELARTRDQIRRSAFYAEPTKVAAAQVFELASGASTVETFEAAERAMTTLSNTLTLPTLIGVGASYFALGLFLVKAITWRS